MRPLLSCLALASAFALSMQEAHAATVPEMLRGLGAQVGMTGEVATQAKLKADAFTKAEYETLGRCTTLKSLTLSGRTLTDEMLPLLAGLVNLEEISLDGAQLTDEGYRHFAPFQKLRSLSLFHPAFRSEAFTGSGLAHLKALPRLERLTFAGSTAGDKALEAIGGLTQLKEFRTWHTAQTQAGNASLLKLTNLQTLKMGQRLPAWGKDSAPSLDATSLDTYARMTSLQTLEIFEARLRAQDLLKVKALPGLKKLVIHTVDIPAADIEEVKKALPGVVVDFKPLSEADREAVLVKKLRL